MKHLLVPIDGSDRSIRSVTAIKDIFSPSNADITLITVREDIDSRSSVILEQMTRETLPMLDSVAEQLPEYAVNKVVDFGIAGNTILKYAKNNAIDVIVITKQTHKGLSVFIGSVAVHVVKYAKCPVIVLPDK
jgi:nucleotide-binding universal stress UspA family protein